MINLGGPDDLRHGVGHHHGQARCQHGQQRVSILAAAGQHPDGAAQQPHKGGQAQHAGLVHNLNELVMDILGFIVKTLYGGKLTLYAADAPSDQGAFLPQLQTVPEEDQTLDEVLVGPQTLETVRGKFGQQGIAQGQLRSVGQGDAVQGAGSAELEPNDPAALRYGEGRPVRKRTLIENGVGVHHEFCFRLAVYDCLHVICRRR